MNKYELCVVLSAKLEDDERAAAIEKIKEYVTRFGGAVGENIQEWGKKRLAYKIQHMKEGFYYFIPFVENELFLNLQNVFCICNQSIYSNQKSS